MKILIVDDDSDQRQIRALLLSQAGFEAFEAGDVAGAKIIAAAEHPQAAVVDLRLPTVEDGLALVRDLKALNPATRLVVLTGAGINVLARRPERLLVDQLLVKPAPTAALIDAIRGVLLQDRQSAHAAG
jgi:Response regulator containing CheY-like receiver, AAA-type ATPase, and DNA-binding domains